MGQPPDETPDVKSIPISDRPSADDRRSGDEVVVTRYGKPLAVVSPIRQGGSGSIYGLYSDGEIVYPDPTAPYFSDEEWDDIVDAWDAQVS